MRARFSRGHERRTDRLPRKAEVPLRRARCVELSASVASFVRAVWRLSVRLCAVNVSASRSIELPRPAADDFLLSIAQCRASACMRRQRAHVSSAERVRRNAMSESILKEITAVGPKPITLNPTAVNYWFWKFVPVDPLRVLRADARWERRPDCAAGLSLHVWSHGGRECAWDASRRPRRGLAGHGVHGREVGIEVATVLVLSSGSPHSVPFCSSRCQS